MKEIHAANIEIELHSDNILQKPYPKFLHGLCYHLAGPEFPHEKYVPPLFHPQITKWKFNRKLGTTATIVISSIDDTFTFNVLSALENAKELQLGYGFFEVTNFTLLKHEKVSLEPENSKPVPDEFKIEFVTPTTFRYWVQDRYLSKAYPDIGLFIRSVSRDLHILFNVEISLEEQEKLAKDITLINAIGYPFEIQIGKGITYDDTFIGELHLDCSRLDEGQRKLLGMLIKAAKYAGVGHHKGYGYGHVRIKRPMPS